GRRGGHGAVLRDLQVLAREPALLRAGGEDGDGIAQGPGPGERPADEGCVRADHDVIVALARGLPVRRARGRSAAPGSRVSSRSSTARTNGDRLATSTGERPTSSAASIAAESSGSRTRSSTPAKR